MRIFIALIIIIVGSTGNTATKQQYDKWSSVQQEFYKMGFVQGIVGVNNLLWAFLDRPPIFCFSNPDDRADIAINLIIENTKANQDFRRIAHPNLSAIFPCDGDERSAHKVYEITKKTYDNWEPVQQKAYLIGLLEGISSTNDYLAYLRLDPIYCVPEDGLFQIVIERLISQDGEMDADLQITTTLGISQVYPCN